jgi:hypothetical protein
MLCANLTPGTISSSCNCNWTFTASCLPLVVEQNQEAPAREDNAIAKYDAPVNTRLVVRPEDFIWLELSIVPEVERVFVERHGTDFSVVTVVNDRDPALRRRIYEREKAIIDTLADYQFNFGLLTRMNHDIKELIAGSEKPAYVRK